MVSIYIVVWYLVYIFYIVWKVIIWLEYVVIIIFYFFFVNKYIDIDMLYCWLIVSKFCYNVIEIDICFYWGMSLDFLVYNFGILLIEFKG